MPLADYEELDLTGLEIDAGFLAGQVIRKSFGGGNKRKINVGPSYLMPRWKLSSGAWPGDDSYGNLINGMNRFDYYVDFFQRFTTGEDDVFVIDFHGKKWTVRFVPVELPFTMHSYDLFDNADGLEVEYAFVPGETDYDTDGSLALSLMTISIDSISSLLFDWTDVDGADSYDLEIRAPLS